MRTVFKPLTQAAVEARRQIQKEFASVSVGMKGSFAEGGRAARKSFADTTKAGDEMSRELARQASRRATAAEQESKREWASAIRLANEAGRERIRILNANNRLELQAARQLERDKARAVKQNEHAVGKFADRTSHRATRFLMPNMPIMSMASRAGHEILRGVGVEADISSLIRRGVGIEQGAAKLSNRGHIEGDKGANGLVVNPKALEAEARKAGAATAVNPEEILAAGREFVGLTGDLDLWRKIMPGIVAQTKALGGNQEEAARAAGEFAAHIGDVPDKAKAVLSLAHVAAGQGKIGGVDFSDFAKYAAKVAAPAAMFKGDKTQNIGKLTAIAEIAKMHGGASSAAMAFGSIDSLVNTLRKPARFKSIKGLLGNENGQFSDATHSELMDPHELIKQLIVASSKDKNGKSGKSDIGRVSAAVGDARSMKAIAGLQMTFNEAGGGQAGLDAMNAELKKFSGAMMSDAEVARGLAAALDTTESKAERFNQKLEGITHGAMAKLVPALESLEQPALNLAGHLGDLAAWVATNPGSALIDAVGLVIARAGIESAFRHGIETIIKNVAGSAGSLPVNAGGAGGLVAGAGGLAGLFTSAVVIGALAYAIEEAGEMALTAMFKKGADANREEATQTGNDGAALANAMVHGRQLGPLREGGLTTEDVAALEKAADHTKKQIDAATNDVATVADPMGAGFGSDTDAGSRADSKETVALKAELAKMTAILDAIKNGKLMVHVTNMPPPDQPKAPVAGTPWAPGSMAP
jgi:hypothetical protein